MANGKCWSHFILKKQCEEQRRCSVLMASLAYKQFLLQVMEEVLQCLAACLLHARTRGVLAGSQGRGKELLHSTDLRAAGVAWGPGWRQWGHCYRVALGLRCSQDRQMWNKSAGCICPVHWFPVCTASNALLDLEKSLTCRFMDAVREYAEAGLQSVCTFFLFPFLFDAGHWRKQGMMPCPVVWFRVLLLCEVVPLNRSKFKPQPAAGNATWQTLSGWRGSGKVASPVFCSGNWKQSILPLYPTCSLSQKRSRGAVKLKMFFSVGWDQAMDILRDPVGVRDRKEGKQRGYEGGKGKTSCKGLVLWH